MKIKMLPFKGKSKHQGRLQAIVGIRYFEEDYFGK